MGFKFNLQFQKGTKSQAKSFCDALSTAMTSSINKYMKKLLNNQNRYISADIFSVFQKARF